MLLQYFGFREEPFGVTPDPRCLYPSQTHREALASIKYGFQSNRGFTAMIAPPGMGKTTLLRRFLEDVRESTCLVFLFDIDSTCEPREFVGYILREIGISPAKSSAEMHAQLSDALVRENRAGRRFVIVIDEAQNLSDAVLERVRLLTNFETSRGKLMHIVLSGQPQLSEKLMQPSLLQLRQRISTICRLEPLSAEETVAYIDFRLKQAGYAGNPLFTQDALKLIIEASQGTPRTINNLCFNALSLCRAMKRKQVDGNMMVEVIGDLELIPKSPKSLAASIEVTDEKSNENDREPKSLLKRWLLAATAMAILCAAGGLGFIGLKTSAASTAANQERSLDRAALPAQVTVPVANDTAQAKVLEHAQNTQNFQIKVLPGQRLQDIAVTYLGGFDSQRLHQIQALNPKLTNPNHIEVGQSIWLPWTQSVAEDTDAPLPTGERKAP